MYFQKIGLDHSISPMNLMISVYIHTQRIKFDFFFQKLYLVVKEKVKMITFIMNYKQLT